MRNALKSVGIQTLSKHSTKAKIPVCHRAAEFTLPTMLSVCLGYICHHLCSFCDIAIYIPDKGSQRSVDAQWRLQVNVRYFHFIRIEATSRPSRRFFDRKFERYTIPSRMGYIFCVAKEIWWVPWAYLLNESYNFCQVTLSTSMLWVLPCYMSTRSKWHMNSSTRDRRYIRIVLLYLCLNCMPMSQEAFMFSIF
jgi:hypothetical protein